MKKGSGIVGVVAVIAVAYLAATWYVGKEAQATVERVVAQTNERLVEMLGPEQGASGLKVEITDYDRRFFSSDVSYTFHMRDNEGEPFQWKFHDHLSHGPFPSSALAKGEFMPMLAYSQTRLVATPAMQVWFDSQKGAAPVHAETRIGFGGDGNSLWTFEPTQLSLNGNAVNFSGGTLAVNFQNDFRDNTAEGGFESFSLADEQTGESVQVSQVKLDSSTVNGDDGKSLVKSTASIQTFTLDSETAEAVTLADMAISMDSEQNGNILDGTWRYDFGSVKLGEIDLGSVSLGGKINQLDVATLTEMAAAYDVIVDRQVAEDDAELEMTDAEEAAMRANLAQVLQPEPSLLIDPVLWKNDKGQSAARLFVQLGSPENQQMDIDVVATEILRRIELELTLSRAMLVQAFSQAQSDPQQRQQMEMMGGMIYDQYTARLQRAGLINVQGDTATLAVVYENQNVDVNGRKMAIDEFLQSVLSAAM